MDLQVVAIVFGWLAVLFAFVQGISFPNNTVLVDSEKYKTSGTNPAVKVEEVYPPPGCSNAKLGIFSF
jgi:hypothetical protein